MNWYLIQTKPNGHWIAYKNLLQQGFEVFLPLILKTTKKAGKFVDAKLPLFPNYLFIGTKSKKVPWISVNSTRGVSKAVTFDGKYRNIDTEIIEGLSCRCDKWGLIQMGNKIKIGDKVKIENGPFTDFICEVEKIAEGHRITVLTDLMQQSTRTQVSINDVSKVC